MEARKPRIVRPYVFRAVRSRFHAMNLALPAPATGYAPPPAGLTLYAVEASALPTDEALMLAWAGGDLRAFESLYARHRKRLFGFLLRHRRAAALPEELFKAVWRGVTSARAGWQPEAAFSTWLSRTAHTRLNAHWRAARPRPAAPADADLRLAAIEDGQ